MLTLGIILGIAAALAQSVSYIFSRLCIRKYKSSLQLLVFSHIIMGAFAAPLLIFLIPPDMPPVHEYILPLLGCTFFYIGGQWAFFKSLRHAEASRISPLLGIKILLIAGIFSLCTGVSFSLLQWLAVFMGMIAAVILNWTGESIPWRGVLWLLAACTGYSISDINIKWAIDHMGGSPVLTRSMCVAAMSYSIAGAISVFVALFKVKPSREKFTASLPFAIAWFSGALFLFGSFGFIGPVFGNIVQSSRGIFSIFIGAAVARMGYLSIERSTGTRVLVQRIIAASLMMASIAIFYLAA